MGRAFAGRGSAAAISSSRLSSSTGLSPASEHAAAGREKWRAVLAFALPLAVFLAGMRYVGSGDTEPAELLPISLLTHGSLDFNDFVSGSDLPYAYRRVGGRVVSSYPIVAGLLNVPVYAAARLFGADLYTQRFRLSMISACFGVCSNRRRRTKPGGRWRSLV